MSSYLGNIPSNNFVSLKRQVITGNGGSTYTLDHSVASVNDVAIFVNNVRQDPASYSISTTSLTLGGTISSSDSCYVLFLGQALQTVTPDANTITNAMIQDGTIAESKLASGVNTIQEADIWRLTTSTNTNTNDVLSTNWERADDATHTYIGTGMSESSGVFTFPQTGIYLIYYSMSFSHTANDLVQVFLEATQDNSSYDIISIVQERGLNGVDGFGHSASNTAIVDVTDTSNVKVRLSTSSMGTNSNVRGGTDANLSCISFLRIGDT